MAINAQQKDNIKKDLCLCLRNEPEISQVVVFGSFLTKDDPHDIDVAIFQDSNEAYLPLAMKYRRKTRLISRIIPVDIIPIKPNAPASQMMTEIFQGEVIYER